MVLEFVPSTGWIFSYLPMSANGSAELNSHPAYRFELSILVREEHFVVAAILAVMSPFAPSANVALTKKVATITARLRWGSSPALTLNLPFLKAYIASIPNMYNLIVHYLQT